MSVLVHHYRRAGNRPRRAIRKAHTHPRKPRRPHRHSQSRKAARSHLRDKLTRPSTERAPRRARHRR
nr:MAG TPA: hypothetical protein [Caudoviricetes sp.]